MKKPFIVGNWKSYKTQLEATKWLQEFSISKEIIVCPPFTLLPLMSEFIKEHTLPIKLGAQDISPFDEGKYTGAINGRQIKEFAEYVIIGHSERREHFLENDAMLEKKVAMAKKYELIPIFCVQGTETPLPEGVALVAYEPVSAIGTGNPDTPENAEYVASFFREKHAIQSVLYGGSVTAKNVNAFTRFPSINGVLVGGASLDSTEFLQIVKNA